MTHPQIKLIHVAARTLGIDEDTRRALQLVTTGKTSLTEMSVSELDAVVLALKARGFAPGAKFAAKGRKPASRGDIRFCHVLWGKLVKAGATDQRGAKGLNAFVRARFEATWGAAPIDIDKMQDAKQIATVIEALKAMSSRAGVVL